MDPASASVAFIGFAASIAQLAGSALHSCQILHGFCRDMSSAPHNVERLSRLVRKLEIVTRQIEAIDRDANQNALPVDIGELWNLSAADMRADLERFEKQVSKLRSDFGTPGWSQKHWRARVRAVFSDEETTKYERILSAHIEAATFMLSLTVKSVTENMNKHITHQTTYMQELRRDVETLQDSLNCDRTERQILEALQKGNVELHEDVARELQTLELEQCTPHEAHAVTVLRNLPVQETCLGIRRHANDLDVGRGLDSAIDAPDRLKKSDLALQHIARPRQLHIARLSRQTNAASWQILLYQCPIGHLTIFKRQSTVRRSRKAQCAGLGTTSWSINFSLFPAQWIAKSAIKLSIGSSDSGIGSTSLYWNLSQAAFNADPELLRCIRHSDVAGLSQLLRDGRAKPSDVVAPWGNSLLHEVVYSNMSGFQDAMEMCELLLEHGADPNYQNAKGRTPLLACCHLMNNTNEHGRQLQELAGALIEGGTELALCDQEGYSPCSLILQSHSGIEFLRDFVYRYVDLFTMQEMASSDAWVLAAVARSQPAFKARLDAEFRSYRTAPSLSGRRDQRHQTVIELDIDYQVEEVKRSSKQVRTTFMECLCTNGTREMVQPFIDGGIDLNELSKHTKSYAQSAAKEGNLDVLMALMNGGASLYTGNRCYIDDHTGPLDDLLERWYSLRCGRPEYSGSVDSELWVLPQLLLHPTFSDNDVLFRALNTRQPAEIFQYLLDAGCGRRDGMPAATWMQKTYGSEVIEAVKCNDPILTSMIQYGLALECEDRTGYTALLHALDCGPGVVNSVKVLVQAGADVTRRTKSGLTPLELAERNMQQRHPRMPRHTWTVGKGLPEVVPVSLEDDQAAYETLQGVVRVAVSNRAFCSHIFVAGTINLENAAHLPRLNLRDTILGYVGVLFMMCLLACSSATRMLWNSVLRRDNA